MFKFNLVTSYAATLFSIMLILLLIIGVKKGDRSRKILLAIMILMLSLFLMNFLCLFNQNDQIMNYEINNELFVFIYFVLLFRLMYPLEVLFAGYFRGYKLLVYFSSVLLIYGLNKLLLFFGFQDISYNTLGGLFENIYNVDSWYKIFLIIIYLSFAPAIHYLYLRNKCRFNNNWFQKYIVTLYLTTFSYILVLINYNYFFLLYYNIIICCYVYVVYLELYERYDIKIVKTDKLAEVKQKNGQADLFAKLEDYMQRNKAWRDSELTMKDLVTELATNRTTFAKVIQDNGYKNYSDYINHYRINDFIDKLKNSTTDNIQDLYFDVGFNSRITAHRNFKKYTDTTPTEYIKNLNKQKKDSLETKEELIVSQN